MKKVLTDPASKNRRLKAARESTGLSLKQVAQKLGKAITTVRAWERDRGPGPKTQEDLVRLCQLLGITEDWYLEGIGPMVRAEARLPDDAAEMIEIWGKLKEHQKQALLVVARSYLA